MIRKAHAWSGVRLLVHHESDGVVANHDAVVRWTETCTAVGVRWRDGVDVCAPHGLADLFALVVRPTSGDEHYVDLVRSRVEERHWLSRWPRLRVDLPPLHGGPGQ